MSNLDESSAWIERAEEDYAVARSALRRKTPLTYIACFHAQQCAEKYLKAVLVSRGQSFPKTHDLLALNTLCEIIGVLTGFPSESLAKLSAYAVQIRYPGENLTLDEAKESVEIAKAVRRFVRKYLGIR